MFMGWTLPTPQLRRQEKQPKQNVLEGLTYEVADLNTAEFPKERYDAVYAHASLHHVFHLEHLLDQIKGTLKPGGLFFVQEYVGPSQMQFPQDHLYLADVFLKAIPERYRRMRDGRMKQQAARLPLHMMNSSDPSEAIRAARSCRWLPAGLKCSTSAILEAHCCFCSLTKLPVILKQEDTEVMPAGQCADCSR